MTGWLKLLTAFVGSASFVLSPAWAGGDGIGAAAAVAAMIGEIITAFIFCSLAAGLLVGVMSSRSPNRSGLGLLSDIALCTFGAALGIVAVNLVSSIKVYGFPLKLSAFAIVGAFAFIELVQFVLRARKHKTEN